MGGLKLKLGFQKLRQSFVPLQNNLLISNSAASSFELKSPFFILVGIFRSQALPTLRAFRLGLQLALVLAGVSSSVLPRAHNKAQASGSRILRRLGPSLVQTGV